jgi:ankyrin repeat protein
LLAAKADVNEPEGDGTTALHWAGSNDDGEAAELLIRAGASVDAVTRNGALTPLMVAAANGSAAVIEKLLAAGAKAEVRSTDGATPLMLAAASGSVEAVRSLIEHGADVNAKDGARGQTPLMFAAASNRAEVIRELLQRRADVALVSQLLNLTKVTVPDDNPVPVPARRAAPGAASSKPDPLAKAKEGRRARATAMGGLAALHFAARNGQLDAARALIEGGADINQVNTSDGSTALITAASNGHYELAKYLLDKGADVNLANQDGLTPLYATIEAQFAPTSWSPTRLTEQEKVTHLELMDAMLERGANPNARLGKKLWFRPSDHDDVWVGTAGTTAFWRAAFANDVDAMRLLVRRGADPNLASNEGNTPAMAAAGLGWTANLNKTVAGSRIPALKLCLELGANLSATDEFKYTALHGAAYRGDNELVQFLVEQGAPLQTRTIFGTSVTDMANGFVAYSSLPRVHTQTVELLLKLGAPKPSPDRQGEAAYCNAKALNCPLAEPPQ